MCPLKINETIEFVAAATYSPLLIRGYICVRCFWLKLHQSLTCATSTHDIDLGLIGTPWVIPICWFEANWWFRIKNLKKILYHVELFFEKIWKKLYSANYSAPPCWTAPYYSGVGSTRAYTNIWKIRIMNQYSMKLIESFPERQTSWFVTSTTLGDFSSTDYQVVVWSTSPIARLLLLSLPWVDLLPLMFRGGDSLKIPGWWGHFDR